MIMISKQGAVFTVSYYSWIDVVIIREKMVMFGKSIQTYANKFGKTV